MGLLSFTKHWCKFPKLKADKCKARVDVARDVIKQINAEKYRVISGTGYIEPLYNVRSLSEAHEDTGCPLNVQSAYKTVVQNCTVCAKGALMLSAFRKYDGQGLQELVENDLHVDSDVIKQQMKGLFSKKQLDLMEAAFELWHDPFYIDNILSEKEVQLAYEFGVEFSNDNDRLIAIMQNVIDHKGEFRPEVKYELV